MRKIAKDAARALANGENFRCKNTEVTHDGAMVTLRLHGSVIMRIDASAAYITLAGYNTVTTRSRLNDVCRELAIPFRCCQRQHEPHAEYITPTGMHVDAEVCADDWFRVSLYGRL